MQCLLLAPRERARKEWVSGLEQDTLKEMFSLSQLLGLL